ncbi:MAG: gluconokinase [Pyrinomonadaceae bacterium]|nr:gluconokinase [Pyrinomonadaceae bacterium]
MDQPLILGLDIGTSSVRAALYTENADIIPRSLVRLDHSFTVTPDGGSEFDADEMVSRIAQVIDSVLARPRKGEIEAVAVSAFWHSLLGVDRRGNPVTPVFGWADTRSRDYSAVLKERFDERLVHDRTGAHFHSSFWPAKLLWLRRSMTDVFARADHWLSFSDYLAQQLSGTAVTSVSMASGTGIFDQARCDWDGELLRYLKVRRSQLPHLAADSEAIPRLKPAFVRRWQQLKKAVWFPAVADGAVDHVASSGLGQGRASLMVGTSAAMRVAFTGEPPEHVPDGLWCYRIDRRRVIIGGALSDGGNLYELLTRTLNIPKNAEEQMRQRGAAAHGLTVLPFFLGERSTGYREDARGAILGLIASHDAIDVLQAAMESVAYRLAVIQDQLKHVTKIKHIVASGGALHRSSVWTQIIADVLGRDLLTNSTPEASMRGAVLLALESLGKIDNIDSFSSPAAIPLAYHTECHTAYREARKQHEEYYKLISK